ncbi:TAXI family TRAP transporter solute-binding subunit [Salipaludibacillus sp. CF4.18]|uniref:TAXI family TRAP transporter solute-binding subunit n=1 Tax=Salipaludibacillus sp. CF4.18 TaxID=3373081 RepID=UPI003EE6A842
MMKNLKIHTTVLSSLIVLSACGGDSTGTGEGESSSSSGGVNIATHPAGQGYHGAGTGLADVIINNSELQVSIRPYSGPATWMSIFNNDQEVNMGFLSLPDAIWAYNGENVFEESDNIRALVAGNENVLGGYTVRQDSGINSLQDLEGKSVAAEYPGNNIISSILEAELSSVGLTLDDLEPVPISDPNAGLDALREGRVDAVFTGSPEAAGALELHSANPIKALPYGNYVATEIDNISESDLEALETFIPGADITAFEGGYVEEETALITYPTILIGSADQLSDEEAYNVVKALWENYEELHGLHTWLESWREETMFKPDLGVPYHPGAVEFFKEIGVWTDEAEENQQELLNQ